MPPRFHHPHRIVLKRRGQEPETFVRPPSGTGYSHELVEVTECIRAGSTESAIMPLDDTLAVQRILNEACEALGVVHREDTTARCDHTITRAGTPGAPAVPSFLSLYLGSFLGTVRDSHVYVGIPLSEGRRERLDLDEAAASKAGRG